MTQIHLAGDSTVAPGPLDGSGVIGWGGVLYEMVEDPVRNWAVGGATTASFVAEGHWRALLQAVEAEDLVIIQFGHNDQKDPELAAEGGYRAHLERFVTEVRERRGVPVLVTSLERRLFADGQLRVSHGPYPAVVRSLGRTLDVPVIDLNSFSRWLYSWLGPGRSADLFPHLDPRTARQDTTHLGIAGARTVAAYVAQCLRGIRGLDDDQEALGTWLMQR